MDWHISPVARKSYLSNREFEKDERVSSALVKTEDGELQRVDVAFVERDQVELPGEEICRWTQVFKPKPDDGKEEAEALKLTADNLFISLFEGEEEATLSEENSELKHFLALMLERRRVLRVKARNRKYTRYVHRPSKREFLVPQVALEPQFFFENEEKLSFIIEGGDLDSGGDDDASEEAPEKKDESAD
ncbi:hypothetical protein [Pelagicoccus sp. SDUM812003]|uniref:hypothetical protein n=1 Tax=Pelagicoccus sp. SDUM812003 TaxID=3041267 RepID=UPI00280D2DF0|nr:hypothetical protein [Pelagicoccus sp. SDUM812003]MDQ8203938.1 hypothetical protein [Pelagicoccus sp. SDUM812003]